MSPTAGVLLAGGIVAMIALVIMLAWINAKKLSRSEAQQASRWRLTRSSDSSRLAFLEWMWRRTDRNRHAWGLLEGTRDGWGARVFLFEHEPDVATIGARTVFRFFARSLLSVLRLATDARTAKQRGVLLAVVYEGPTATFKIRRRQVIARNAKARTILGGARSFKIGTWAPPARVELREDWLFVHSFYILPKWLGRYVDASVDIGRALASLGTIRPRPASELPVGPPL